MDQLRQIQEKVTRRGTFFHLEEKLSALFPRPQQFDDLFLDVLGARGPEARLDHLHFARAVHDDDGRIAQADNCPG